MAIDTGYELNWDSEIEQDGQGFVLLPAGKYPFTVINLEKARHTPREGGKLPACPKAILTLRLHATDDGTTIDVDQKYNLFLHSSQEWKLCEFFTAIGDRKHGERLKMNWAGVIGKTGTCELKVRDFIGRDGEKKQSNEFGRFYEPEQSAQPVNVAPTFTAGSF